MSVLRICSFAIILTFLQSDQARGQSHPTDRGSLLIDGQASVRSTEMVIDNKAAGRTDTAQYLDITLNPSVRYFVLPGLAIGGELLIGRNSTSQSGEAATWSYGIGPAATYFFGEGSRAWYPYVGAGVRYHGNVFEDVPGEDPGVPSAYGFRADAGLVLMVAEEVGVNGEFYVDAVRRETEWLDQRSTEFGFALGISAFVY